MDDNISALFVGAVVGVGGLLYFQNREPAKVQLRKTVQDDRLKQLNKALEDLERLESEIRR
jgi:hypothetical protein